MDSGKVDGCTSIPNRCKTETMQGWLNRQQEQEVNLKILFEQGIFLFEQGNFLFEQDSILF